MPLGRRGKSDFEAFLDTTIRISGAAIPRREKHQRRRFSENIRLNSTNLYQGSLIYTALGLAKSSGEHIKLKKAGGLTFSRAYGTRMESKSHKYR